jgi:hypothetical protein
VPTPGGDDAPSPRHQKSGDNGLGGLLPLGKK